MAVTPAEMNAKIVDLKQVIFSRMGPENVAIEYHLYFHDEVSQLGQYCNSPSITITQSRPCNQSSNY